MTKRSKLAATVVILLAVTVGFAQLGSIIKGAAIGVLVSQFGKEMNDGINKLTNTKDTKEYATKVVPIISVGSNAYVGAAQIMGPPEKVKSVQCVAQLEGSFFKKGVRLRALIPITTKTPGKTLDRVVGVGISGLVDIKL